jgi:hypothetical protein
MLSSEFSEVSHVTEPSLKRMFRDHLDMQIADLRVLLRLPTSRLAAGCNFTAAAMLFNLIAGASVCLYGANELTLKKTPPAGAQFRGILEGFYPWSAEPVDAKTGAKVIYKYSRNPLAHNLGLGPEKDPDIEIAKSRMGPKRIAALEESATRPTWAAPALTPHGSDYVLDVAGLYWGTHRMLHAVLADETQRRGAERLATSIGF